MLKTQSSNTRTTLSFQNSMLMLLAFTATLLSSVQSFAQQTQVSEGKTATAIFAGGCFWCMESDFEKKAGVIKVESGYTGGQVDNPTYKIVSYTKSGHYEAVKVSYNPDIVSYSQLVDYFWRHIDPTDAQGQFCDKGESYRSAIFYQNAEQQQSIEASLEQLKKTKPFKQDIVTLVLPAKEFYLAEEKHQDYYKKNPLRYKYYRNGCGRDKRVQQLWGKQEH